MSSAKNHDGKLGLSAVSLTTARAPRYDLEVFAEIKAELESVMVSSGYLNDAKFEWVTLIHRYGLKNEEEPHYQRINKKYGDLPLGIELDTQELLAANREELKRLFMLATLKALIHAGRKHKLPTEKLEELKNDWIATV